MMCDCETLCAQNNDMQKVEAAICINRSMESKRVGLVTLHGSFKAVST